MGREPRTYSVFGRIAFVDGKYVVTVSALSVDRIGPDEFLGDTCTVQDKEEARQKCVEMVRAMCHRLEAQGNRLANVDLNC